MTSFMSTMDMWTDGDDMKIRDNGDGTVDLFNAAGHWIGWARKDAYGVELQSTGAPLDSDERQSLEDRASREAR